RPHDQTRVAIRSFSLRDRAIRLMPHPPIPWKLVDVTMLARHYKADRNHECFAAAMGFFRACRAVAVGLSRIAFPTTLWLDDIAAGTLEPFRKAHGNEASGVRIVILPSFERHRGCPETLHTKLLLQAGLTDDLRVGQSCWRKGT